jgi:thiosulfate dehydrogenase
MKYTPDREFIIKIKTSIFIVVVAVLLICGFTQMLFFGSSLIEPADSQISLDTWKAPAPSSIPDSDEGKLIRYGRELIINTSHYMGPNGSVFKISNGMNCQNCHLDAGTKYMGNDFRMVAATYPRYRPRSGSVESIEKRINDCFERSLNGFTLDSLSQEMMAMVAYIKWVGKDWMANKSNTQSSRITLPFLDRAANPKSGALIYTAKCSVCHGSNGQGLLKGDSVSWQNPPLWGDRSYNTGAGIFRLSCFAEFVKTNMPLDAPQLSEEEAWDVAAYVNSMPRPGMNVDEDWPDISKKPPDYPFGPFVDSLSLTQHKYGPFQPIVEMKKKIQQEKIP